MNSIHKLEIVICRMKCFEHLKVFLEHLWCLLNIEYIDWSFIIIWLEIQSFNKNTSYNNTKRQKYKIINFTHEHSASILQTRKLFNVRK